MYELQVRLRRHFCSPPARKIRQRRALSGADICASRSPKRILPAPDRRAGPPKTVCKRKSLPPFLRCRAKLPPTLCSCTPRSPTDRRTAPNAQTDRPQTRATPIETANFYDSFGVLASVYTGSWSETSCLPDYMYNVEVTKASSWTTSYHWPGSGRNIRFFAYAPYNGTGISLSSATKAGTPSIAYTVPKAVGAQRDLLVAATSGIAGNTAAAAPLTFAHALTAIRFTTGDDMLAGRITKITLKSVYGSGSYTMGFRSWGDYGATADFSQTLTADVDGSADQVITPVAATFMMLPQALPSGASIEVVYRNKLTSTLHTLTASIAGSQWPIGKTVTYRISTSSISMTPTFSVTPPSAFTYAGGSQNYSVTSCAAVSRSGDASQTVPVAWTAEFVEDDGAGGYNVISRPTAYRFHRERRRQYIGFVVFGCGRGPDSRYLQPA